MCCGVRWRGSRDWPDLYGESKLSGTASVVRCRFYCVVPGVKIPYYLRIPIAGIVDVVIFVQHAAILAPPLTPTPPEALVALRSDAFQAVLAATGTPPALFTDSDGTSQREAVRRWHANVVLPMAGMLQTELREKLETDITLTFDNYPKDLQGRAAAFAKMVTAGVDIQQAMATTGLLIDD